jgi:enoyl-[acyl-carrier protein] reductase III
MSKNLFKNKVALITGSSRGIGSAIALKFASSGADIVINQRKAGGTSQTQGEKLCKTINIMGSRAILVQADISCKESVAHLFNQVKEHFGTLDFLILNAARAPFKPFNRLLERELKQLIETNFVGNIFCIQQSLPLLEETKGAVIFISSLGSRFYNPAYPLGSMKAAMESVIRDCSESFSNKSVTFNAICGGIVKTDSFKVLRQYWEELEQTPDELFVEPEEIADVALFLCSHAGRGIHGQTIVVDRGLSNRLYRSGKGKPS